MYKTTGQLEKTYKADYGLTRHIIVGYTEKGLVRFITTAKGHLRVNEGDIKRVLGIVAEDSE
jgi:predicted site-specific integrase-resolvase